MVYRFRGIDEGVREMVAPACSLRIDSGVGNHGIVSQSVDSCAGGAETVGLDLCAPPGSKWLPVIERSACSWSAQLRKILGCVCLLTLIGCASPKVYGVSADDWNRATPEQQYLIVIQRDENSGEIEFLANFHFHPHQHGEVPPHTHPDLAIRGVPEEVK